MFLRNTAISENFRAVTGQMRRLAVVALCVSLAGCPMTMKNDVREARLSASGMDPARTKIVYGLDASHGPVNVILVRSGPAADRAGRCSQTAARTPDGSTGTTYFVFDAPPGIYTSIVRLAGVTQASFAVPAGRLVYIGDFVMAPGKKWSPPFDLDTKEPQETVLRRDTAAAKAALGPEAAELELAAMTSPGKGPVVGFACLPFSP